MILIHAGICREIVNPFLTLGDLRRFKVQWTKWFFSVPFSKMKRKGLLLRSWKWNFHYLVNFSKFSKKIWGKFRSFKTAWKKIETKQNKFRTSLKISGPLPPNAVLRRHAHALPRGCPGSVRRSWPHQDLRKDDPHRQRPWSCEFPWIVANPRATDQIL